MAIRTTLYTDSACPWAYSATPALTTLRWRYGDQLDWRLVMIGLRDATETAAPATRRRARPPARGASATATACPSPPRRAPACRVRPRVPGRGGGTARAPRSRVRGPAGDRLRLVQHPAAPRRGRGNRNGAGQVEGIDAAAVIAALDSPRGHRGLRGRQGAGAQRRRRPDRFPGQGGGQRRHWSLHGTVGGLRADERRLEAGGFQPLEAYDVLLANLDTTLRARLPPEGPPSCSSTSPRASARRRWRCCSPAT